MLQNSLPLQGYRILSNPCITFGGDIILNTIGLMTEPELQVQISSVLEYKNNDRNIAVVMNMNNLAGPLVYYYDVGNFMQQYSKTLKLCMFTQLHDGTADNNSQWDWLYFHSTTMQPCKYKKYWHNGIRVN